LPAHFSTLLILKPDVSLVFFLNYAMCYCVKLTIITPPRMVVVVHSVTLSIILSVSRVTSEHGTPNGCRPNMVGMGKGWPSRSE